MSYAPIILLTAGQVFLFGWLMIAYFMEPSFFQGSAGLSNYGASWPLAAPYSLAFGLGAACTWAAAYLLPKRTTLEIITVYGLIIFGGILLVSLISTYPYQINIYLSNIHKVVGFLLLVYQLILGGWLVVNMQFDIKNMLLFAALVTAFVMVVAAFLTPAEYLSHGQALAGLFFAALLVRSVWRGTNKTTGSGADFEGRFRKQ